jgi:hypothetical protein
MVVDTIMFGWYILLVLKTLLFNENIIENKLLYVKNIITSFQGRKGQFSSKSHFSEAEFGLTGT